MTERLPFPAFGATMSLAMELALHFVRDGTFDIDGEGRIWRRRVNGRPIEARRAEVVDSKGYLRVVMGIPGRRKTCHVQGHRLVWEYSVGPIPEGMQVNHKDLDKQNNRLDNLELVDASGNIRHSYANGRPRPWHKATMWQDRPRIDDARKAEVIALRSSGLLLREVSGATGISISHIHRICSEASRKEAECRS